MSSETNMFGTAVMANGCVVRYEGGIIQQDQTCDTPLPMIMSAIAKADWHLQMGASDYSEVANLLSWCRSESLPHDEIDEWLGVWEAESGCHHPHDFASVLLTSLNW